MKLLDELTKQIEKMLNQQKLLEAENKELKKQLKMLANVDETIVKLELEKNQHETAVAELTMRLEKLLTI